MTISYQDDFMRLLLRWKGSLWKTIWKNLLIFIFLYYMINFWYRWLMPVDQQKQFQGIITSFNAYTSQYPLTFMLGFYVAMVIQRWWTQFSLISWPDDFLLCVSTSIPTTVKNSRLLRRTIARYVLLTCVMGWKSLSTKVLARLPKKDNLLATKLITQKEHELYSSVQSKVDPHKMWFIPLNWVQSILVQLYDQKLLYRTDFLMLLKKMHLFRNGFSAQFLFAWVPISLAYTQCAVMAVYGYFAFCLIARQYPTVNKSGEIVDVYFPGFTFLQFLFYVGWLKVGEDLLFPFGTDDEDFEMTYLLERNMEMAYLLVDDLHRHGEDLRTASFGSFSDSDQQSHQNDAYSPTISEINTTPGTSPDPESDNYEPRVRLPSTIGSSSISENVPINILESQNVLDPSEFDIVSSEEQRERNTKTCRPGVVLHSCLSAVCAVFIASVTIIAVYVYFAYK